MVVVLRLEGMVALSSTYMNGWRFQYGAAVVVSQTGQCGDSEREGQLQVQPRRVFSHI